MSANVDVYMKNGTVNRFTAKSRSGGSWELHVKYEGGMVVVVDEWESTVAYPQEDVEHVQTTERHRW